MGKVTRYDLEMLSREDMELERGLTREDLELNDATGKVKYEDLELDKLNPEDLELEDNMIV